MKNAVNALAMKEQAAPTLGIVMPVFRRWSPRAYRHAR